MDCLASLFSLKTMRELLHSGWERSGGSREKVLVAGRQGLLETRPQPDHDGRKEEGRKTCLG